MALGELFTDQSAQTYSTNYLSPSTHPAPGPCHSRVANYRQERQEEKGEREGEREGEKIRGGKGQFEGWGKTWRIREKESQKWGNQGRG